MGYKSDPALTSLCRYRNKLRPKKFQSTIVVLADSQIKSWTAVEKLMSLGIQYADQLGYRVEILDVNRFRDNPRKLCKILKTKGVDGVLIAPQKEVGSLLQMEWDHFSLVRLGHSIVDPVCFTVASQQFFDMKKLLKGLRDKLGYQRIGLFLLSNENDRTYEQYAGAYTLFQQISKRSISPLIRDEWNEDECRSWIESHRIDCVVSSDGFDRILKKIGFEVPQKIGFACINLPSGRSLYPGIYYDWGRLWKLSFQALIGLIQQNIRGVERSPTYLSVEGSIIT